MTRFGVSHLAALFVAAWFTVDGLHDGPTWLAVAGIALVLALVVESAFYLRRGRWRED